jgi:serine/threonine protein kinase/WD40 repeat protein
MTLTLQATCRNCGKVPEPGSPLGLCSRCLMAQLLDHAPAPAQASSDADDYEVLRQLAKGGMGTVMEARDLTLHRTVAMKVMHRTAPGHARERFDREARVLARLEHPNIVPIHAMGRDAEGQPFYTMKLVRGETLQAIINQLRKGGLRTVKRYPLSELLGIFQKVGQAVAFAHSRGVIHRDLKPENIMVGEFGEVLVMDWGLAKLAGEPEVGGEDIHELSDRSLQDLATGLTLDGAVMGTPQFMSPEQASGRIMELDPRTDIFSLGAILYALLTLRPPVRGGSVEEVLAKVRSGNITPPTLYNQNREQAPEGTPSLDDSSAHLQKTRGLPHCPQGCVPEALSAVTMRAMALQTGERYQTVTELLADIEAYRGGFATSVEQLNLFGHLRLLVLRHRVVSGLLAVLLLVTVGFVAQVLASERKAKLSAKAAIESADMARREETRAHAEAANARRALGESRIALADAAMRDRDVGQMRRHLDAVAAEHRNEDWRYLSRMLQPAVAVLPSQPGEFFDDVQTVPGPGGEFIASDRAGNVLVIDAATRAVTRKLPTGLNGQLRLAVSADASLVAAMREGGQEYKVFDYRTGQLRHHLVAAGKAIAAHFVGPAVDRLFVAERNAPAGRMMRLSDGATLWSTQLQSRTAIDPAGKLIAAHYMNAAQDVRLIDAVNGRTLRTMDAEGERSFIWSLAFSADGKLLAAGDHLGDVHLWEVATGRLMRRFNAGVGRLQGLAFGPGETLLTACEEGRADTQAPRSLRVWNHRNAAELVAFLGVRHDEGWFAYHPPTGVVLTRGAELKFYRVPLGQEHTIIPARSDGRYAQFIGEHLLLAGTDRAFIGLHALSSNAPPRQLWTAPHDQFAFALSGDSRSGLVASRAPRDLDGFDLTFDAVGQLAPVRPTTVPSGVAALDLNREGQAALLADVRGGLFFYDRANRQLRGRLHPPKDMVVTHVRYCADDTRAVTLSQPSRDTSLTGDILTLWDLATEQALAAVTNHFVVNGLALDPARRRVAVVGTDLLVRIYDTATLKLEQQFRAHNKPINAVAFHPTLPVLATASDDLSVKLWDLRTGALLDYFIGPTRPPLALSFSPSGRHLAAGCADKTTRVWPVGELPPAAATK